MHCSTTNDSQNWRNKKCWFPTSERLRLCSFFFTLSSMAKSPFIVVGPGVLRSPRSVWKQEKSMDPHHFEMSLALFSTLTGKAQAIWLHSNLRISPLLSIPYPLGSRYWSLSRSVIPLYLRLGCTSSPIHRSSRPQARIWPSWPIHLMYFKATEPVSNTLMLLITLHCFAA